MVTDPVPADPRAHAELGFQAQRRYFRAYPSPKAADFDAAERYLGIALRDLAPGEPLRADVSFALGAVRVADHEVRCARPCPAPAELAPIAALLAAGGGRDGAPIEQLYPYAMTVDKLYDHTHDPADIDLAITWLRRAAGHRRTSPGDRRSALISLAVQHANQGAARREAQCRSGPGSQSWTAFGDAITQFEEVLADLSRPGRRSDKTRADDRLDAWLGLLETYYQRGGERPLDEDLDVMAGLARTLIAAMTPGHRLRPYALGRCGVLLLERIMRRIGDPWDLALNAAVQSMQPTPIREAVASVPGLDADLDAATWALAQATGLEDYASSRQPLVTAAMCSARALRYLAHGGDEDLREFGRLCRIVMGHPHIGPFYKRSCGEFLLVVLAQQLRGSGSAGLPGGAVRLSPSADADLDTMIGLLARFAATDGARLEPALSSALAEAVTMRADGELSDEELGATYARQQDAAGAFASVPAAHAAVLFQAAVTGAEWVRRGTGPAWLADQVTAAFQEALGGFPATHPIAVEIAARAAAFAGERPAAAPASAAPAAAADRLPSGLEVFSTRALSSLGMLSHGRLAAPAGQVAEIAGFLLIPPPKDAVSQAAIRSLLALAQYTRWLHERVSADLADSIGQVCHAIDLLPEGQPLRARLVEFLAGMLLDRAQVRGDHADVDAALTLLEGLLSQAGTDLAPGDLNELLTTAGPDALRDFLTTPSDDQPRLADSDAAFRLELEAAVGSGLLLRHLLSSGAAGPLDAGPAGRDDLSRATGILRRAADRLPSGSARRPDVLSDLGLALLVSGGDHAAGLRAGLEAMREAASACPPGHPRRAAILLRTAAALAANAQAAYDPRIVDQGIDLLTEALRSAGLDALDDHSRCLYGLGYTLLIRYSQAGRAGDLRLAIASLEEARACLEPSPGDPFMVPLLRALAWAYRRAGESGPGLQRRQARSIGRSVLHAHEEAVLLQGSSRHGIAAARRIGEDALRLAEWCLADGKIGSAVEALELGRALVLHAATVAADVPALLREANQPGLADEWGRQLLAAESSGDHDIDDVPSHLRHRVLTALRHGTAEDRVLAAPTLTQIAAALRAARMDALAYLIPASSEVHGRAVIVHADGKSGELRLPDLSADHDSAVARFAAAHHDLQRATPAGGKAMVLAAQRFRGQLDDLCDWAWTAAIGPLLESVTTSSPRLARLVIAPVGILGIVPWHAARQRSPDYVRYACAEAVFTTCASARQLIEATERQSIPPASRSAVFVANPGRDLPWSEREADAICSALRPGAVYLGRSARTPVSGSGSPDEVLALLRGVPPAVLHFGCHATAGDTPDKSWLQLAGGQLPISRILAQTRTRTPGSPGGLIILASCTSDLTMADYDEALTLSSAFLAAGATGVVGSRWEVNDLHTALLMFMLHRHLVLNPGDSSADALRAAQLWMLDPHRTVPAEMPESLAEQARPRRTVLSNPHAWAAFTYHGQ